MFNRQDILTTLFHEYRRNLYIALAKYPAQEGIADLLFSSSLYTVFSSNEAILWDESSRLLYDISDFFFPLFFFFSFFLFCRTMLSVGQRDSSWCEQWATKLQVKVRSAVTAHTNACFGAYKFLFRGPSTRKPVSVICDDGQGVCDEKDDLFYSTGP